MQKKLVMFGAGARARDLYTYSGIVPDYYVDNHITVPYVECFGRHINILPPATLHKEDKSQLMLLITPDTPISEAIAEQITEMGFKDCAYYLETNQSLTGEDMPPLRVGLEACTLCQLSCKTCYMRNNDEISSAVGKGYLKFEDFIKFIDATPSVKSIELANNGEIFLNPELYKIIEYAHEKRIALNANNGTNFNTISDEVLEALVKYKFFSLSVAIDGASQEVYEKYRINGDFNKVIDNIKRVNALKKEYNSEFPKLRWQYVISENTEGDVIKAKKLANELNMRLTWKLTWDKNYIPIQREMLKRETGLFFLSREEMSMATKKNSNGILNEGGSVCHQLFNTPYINYNGELLGCCRTAKGKKFGINVFEVGLQEALASTQYKQAKALVQGHIKPNACIDTVKCLHCPIYKQMCETNKFVNVKKKYRSCNNIDTFHLSILHHTAEQNKTKARLAFCCGYHPYPSTPLGEVEATSIKNLIDLRNKTIYESLYPSAEKSHICSNCSQFDKRYWGGGDGLIHSVSLSLYPSPCQARCIYCHPRKKNPQYFIFDKSIHIAQYNKIFSLLDYLIDNQMLADDVSWHFATGEITIHPLKEKLFSYIKKNTALFLTNAFIVDDFIINNLASNSLSTLSFSIDSGTAETWKKVKGVNNFTQTINNLQLYAKKSNPGQILIKYIILPGINDEQADFEGLMEIIKQLKTPVLTISRDMSLEYSCDVDASNLLITSARRLNRLCILNGMRTRFDHYSKNEIKQINL
ncbi:MAG: radical SAM protein [Defluviitaleaceae bacterium]|nr:radical SAM protein [Defluviitaleaceae bacterium]MCL2274438.1 radical SAM protein [Defluviitaleaceae bacterium]